MPSKVATKAAAKAAGPTAKREIVKIHVKFTLNTPDGLRRVKFELEKETAGDTVSWTITFQLFERAKKSDQFSDPIVDLEVYVDTKLNAKAENMADNGMSPNQTAYAVGPAADTAKKATPAKAKAAVQKTLNK